MIKMPRLNITQKFVGYLLFLGILPLVLFAVITYRNSSALLLTESRRYTSEIIANQSDYLDLLANQIESLVTNISGVETIREALDDEITGASAYTTLSTRAEIGYILNGYINITGLVSIDIFTNNGVHYQVGDTLNSDNIRDEVRQRIYDQALSSTQSITWVGAEQNVNASSSYPNVITAAKVIYETNRETLQQEPIALFLVNYSLEELHEHFTNVDFGENAYMMVIDSQGRLIYHPDNNLLATSLAPDVFQKVISGGDSEVETLGGIPVSITYTTSETTGWHLVSIVPIDTLNAKTSVIGTTVVSVLLVCLAIVSLAGWFFNRSVVTPIREITHSFQRLNTEPPDQQKQLVSRSQDEIGELVQWFNTFLDNLIIRQRTEKELLARIESERAIDAERVQLIEKLEESLRFKDQFLATMSHELRTPLNAIQGYSGLVLQGDEALSEDTRYMITRILSNSRRLLGLINDVLDISRINAHRVDVVSRPIYLHEMLQNWYSDFNNEAQEKHLIFALDVDPSLPRTIMGDEARLTQIAANLLHNAFKFTDQGTVKLSAKNHGINWSFSVTDSGIGIPENWMHLIFDEFRQVDSSSKRQYGGAGLGLSIVKKLCLLMGGDISVESKLGEGSTFTVTLPLVVENSMELTRK